MTKGKPQQQISLKPQLKSIYTEDGVKIQGIGRTKEISYAVVDGTLTRIKAGERLSISGSTGMDYLGPYGFLAVRLKLLSTGQEAVYRAQ